LSRSISRTLSPLFVLALVAGACAPAAAPISTPPTATAPVPATGATQAAISAADLELRLGILAHDSLRGREVGTPGIDAAARYLVAEIERLGLRPAGDDGGYLHRVPLERRRMEANLSVSTSEGRSALDGSDAVFVSGIGGLPEASRLEGSGSLVFAGHLVDPSVGDREVTPEQLRGAIPIVRISFPPGVDPATTPPRMALASLFAPTSPAAAVLLVAEEADEAFWHYAGEVDQKGLVTLAGAAPGGAPSAPPIFLISARTAERLIGETLAGARTPRTELGTFEYSLVERTEAFDAWNVAAVLPGRDATLQHEHVSVGAHYDHVGVGAPVDGDSIYNGADDNASGTSAMLEVAERFAHLPLAERPRRSVLFVWHTAEEAGLLGSEHFTDRPTVPRESIVSHINLDMVGRNHPDSLSVVGSRRLASELGDVVEAVNRRQNQPFVFDYTYDAPGHPEMIYCRSDHWSFARYGIPIVFFTSGLHDDYHAPSDRPELIDYDKLARVSTLTYDLLLELGNRDAAPRVDQPVPPLGAPCQ
jgi:hypothetical protein